MMRRSGNRRRGLALVLVTVHAVLILSAWAIANRETVELMRLKEQVAHWPEPAGSRDTACRYLALSYAAALLQTGDPPSAHWECAVDINPDPARDPDTRRTYAITFDRVSVNPAQWRVGVAEPPAGDSNCDALPHPARLP